MPITKSALRRYRIIDAAINNKQKPFPTKTELLDKLAEKLGQPISESTLDKDIYDMKNELELGYDAPIQFNKAKGGYQYTEVGYSISKFPVTDSDMEAIRFAADTLEQYSDIPLFKQFREAITKINVKLKMNESVDEEEIEKVVMFEYAENLSGVEWLRELLSAINNRQQVKFAYENIYKGQTKSYVVHPYLLKEFRNRWYLISWSSERKDFLTFGLDRVSKLEVLRDSFVKKKDFKPELFFKHSIGITEFDRKPVDVVLDFDPMIGKLIKTQMIHPSQKVMSDKANVLKIKLHVFITEELIQLILGWGQHVTVSKPKELRDEICLRLKKMLGNYK
jgi:predicted DNA-binding transcriptional regulator YafY